MAEKRFTRTAMVLAVPVLLAGAWARSACHSPADEPVPPPRSAPPSEPSDAPAASATAPARTMAPEADPRLRDRCIAPWPAEPLRRVEPGPDPRCPVDPEPERVPLDRHGRVEFPAAGASLAVELAIAYEDRMRGLMYRRKLSDADGMLFVFEERQDHRFWMRNTCIPLDMLYIDTDGLIVGIQENVPTLNDSTYRVGCPSVYVLEAAAGWARRHGVRPGQFVRFEGL